MDELHTRIYEQTLEDLTTESFIQTDKEWQNRSLESLYLIVWIDSIDFKVKEEEQIIHKTVYLCIGLNKEGTKEVLGMWIAKTKGVSFWTSVLTDLKSRGVIDILITVTDNPNGFTNSIQHVFPQSIIQICIIHQIRNSSRYVTWKEKKEFSADLKNIYNAPSKETAKMELDLFEQRWVSKYPYSIRSWRNNWKELAPFFDFPVEIRKIIYSTNLVEALNGKIKMYTKNIFAFPNDETLKKSLYLAINETKKEGCQFCGNWNLVFNLFLSIIESREAISL